jgi:hypothetical protein
MGNTHNNIIMVGPSQDQIVAALQAREQGAFVSPTRNGITFVWATDDGWAPLAEDLSRTCGGLALFASVYDSDIFEYALYEEGRLIDKYNSAPDYFDGEGLEGDEPHAERYQPSPTGGNARVLCTAFAAEPATAQAQEILHPPVEGAIRLAGIDAYYQHWALAEAIGWPPNACVIDYEDLDESRAYEDLLAAFGGTPPIKTPA